MIGVFPAGDIEMHVGKWRDHLAVNKLHSPACCGIGVRVLDTAILGSDKLRVTGNLGGPAISLTVAELGQKKDKEMPKSPRGGKGNGGKKGKSPTPVPGRIPPRGKGDEEEAAESASSAVPYTGKGAGLRGQSEEEEWPAWDDLEELVTGRVPGVGGGEEATAVAPESNPWATLMSETGSAALAGPTPPAHPPPRKAIGTHPAPPPAPTRPTPPLEPPFTTKAPPPGIPPVPPPPARPIPTELPPAPPAPVRQEPSMPILLELPPSHASLNFPLILGKSNLPLGQQGREQWEAPFLA